MREKKRLSLLRQWIELNAERQKTHKALRILAKQEWSIEFLTALLIRASKITGEELEMTLKSPAGMTATIRTIDAPQTPFRDESIFNHLDDEFRVNEFIKIVNSK
jgi:hypothetical protein